MIDISPELSGPSLGVGRIIVETFSICFRKLPVILLLGYIPSILQTVVVGLAAGMVEAGEIGSFISGLLFVIIMVLLLGSFVAAAVVQLCDDVQRSQPVRPGRYLALAVRKLPMTAGLVMLALFGLMLGVGVGFAAGNLLSATLDLTGLGLLSPLVPLLPVLWLIAVCSVSIPAVVIEGAGIRSLARSAYLTRNFRWSIAGVLLLMSVCVLLLMIASRVITTIVIGLFPDAGDYFGFLISGFGNVLPNALVSIALALIYSRLKVIKEGIAVSDLMEVFR